MLEPIHTVVVRQVTKQFQRGREVVTALSDVSFRLLPGTMTALVGPSGCGKSTLLNLLGCLDLPTAGEVEIAGVVTQHLADDALTALRRDQVGSIFQAFHLISGLTLAENVAIPLQLARVARPRVAEFVQAALARVGILELADVLPSQASGGQQQRAAIARAIVRPPAVLLADEPTGSLDSHNGALVMDVLRKLADDGQTILLATHSAEAAAVCDRTLSLRDGCLIT